MPKKQAQSSQPSVPQPPVCNKECENTTQAYLANAEPFEDPNHPARWKHRRRMAYASLVNIIAVTFILLGPWVPIERVDKLSDIISWFYFSLASIVGAYMGFATWSAKLNKG